MNPYETRSQGRKKDAASGYPRGRATKRKIVSSSTTVTGTAILIPVPATSTHVFSGSDDDEENDVPDLDTATGPKRARRGSPATASVSRPSRTRVRTPVSTPVRTRVRTPPNATESSGEDEEFIPPGQSY